MSLGIIWYCGRVPEEEKDPLTLGSQAAAIKVRKDKYKKSAAATDPNKRLSFRGQSVLNKSIFPRPRKKITSIPSLSSTADHNNKIR